jgi:hypothetical protein
MNGKTTLTAILFFAMGLYMGSFHLRPAPIAATPAPPSGLEKLQSLAEVDFEDYYRLKTMEEKYVKADEILGKIMVIFLADLGLRVSREAQEASQIKAAPLERNPEPVSPKARELPAPTSGIPTPDAEKQDLRRLARMEEKLLEVRDERAVEGFLRRVKFDDLEATLKSSSGFANRSGVLSALNGSFEGRARVRYAGKSEGWDMHLDVAATMSKAELSGSVKTRLLKEGKVFSNSHSNGDKIDVFREFVGSSSALLVKASPQIYLQLYYLKEIDQLAANIYRRASEAEGFEHIGSASLKRSQ